MCIPRISGLREARIKHGGGKQSLLGERCTRDQKKKKNDKSCLILKTGGREGYR